MVRQGSKLRIIAARSATDLIKREAQQPGRRTIVTHDQSVGGILVGKRLANDRIALVAATDPGPNADSSQLGFALDLTHANQVLQHWFAHDPDVDVIGVWHTHPPDQDQPTEDDVQAARALFDDEGYGKDELVNALVVIENGAPRIWCFFLSRADARAGKGFAFVPYAELDDDDPMILEPAVTVLAAPPDTGVVPPVRVPAAPAPAQPSRRKVILAGLGTLAALLAVALLLALTRGGGPERQANSAGTATGQQTSEAPTVDESGTTSSPGQTAGGMLAATPDQTDMPAAVTTAAPTPAPSPTSPSQTSTASPTQVQEPTATVTTVATPTPTIGASLPYTLRFEPMETPAVAAFLRRARQLQCERCYNLDIVGPTPFVDVRIRVEGLNRPPLRNYAVPSLAELPPRPEPYTLQAFDLQGQPLSPPLTFTVAEGRYYVLTITRVQP